GGSRFYLSGDDDLVRLFAGDRITRIMERFKIPDDQPMEAKILSNQIENAQKKVEEQNFVMRKNVLKYDDVMNVQRVVIYEQRRAVLEGADLSDEVKSWVDEVVANVVAEFTQEDFAEEWDIEGLVRAMHDLYGTDMTAEELREEVELSREELVEEFQGDARDTYDEKEAEFGENPEDGQPIMREIERFVILQTVDLRWREHLENMDYLREGVHLRAMAQKDPLVEYRHEGHIMFEELGRAIHEEVVHTLFHAQLEPGDVAQLESAAQADAGGDLRYEHQTAAGADVIAAAGGNGGGNGVGGSTATAAIAGGGSVATAATVRKGEHESLGRNDPCWCGSGKKFKKCHGA
ncbi:MAG: preprotein translocase subunit SecA, partial [Gaiellaceae bacterium]|nr:preprotein translocase subunit SecA [Gaiellaceae bacterium]